MLTYVNKKGVIMENLDNLIKKYSYLENLKPKKIEKLVLEQINDILSLPHFKEKKFQKLICDDMFKKNRDEIMDILDLPYWCNTKYIPLLSKDIWNRTSDEIIEILDLPYWDDTSYVHLLTNKIWKNPASKIVSVINIPYFNDPKYPHLQHLLVPSLFDKSVDNITGMIELFIEYKIDGFLKMTVLGKSVDLMRILFEIFTKNDIPLVENGILNNKLFYSKVELKEKLGIDIDKSIAKRKAKKLTNC